MNIQWYPGHMTKAYRMMQDSIKLIDIVIEVRDARIPYSSSNPDIKKLSNGRKRLIILNKADLAETEITDRWVENLSDADCKALACDSRSGQVRRNVLDQLDRLSREKRERDKRRGIKNRPVRCMICGIPNVGKSTLINTLAGRSSARTGNKPGVTRGSQWISIKKGLELMDTPGLLWPKFDDESVGLDLAFTGAVNDQILEPVNLAVELIRKLESLDRLDVLKHYGDQVSSDPARELEFISDSRKILKKGGEPDTDRAASVLLDDLASGRLGRISLEFPEA